MTDSHCRHARCCQCGAARGTPEHAQACPDALIARAIAKRSDGPGRKLKRSPLDRPAVEVTSETIAVRAARLQAVERELSARFELPPQALAAELTRRLRACEIDEDALVTEWLWLRSETA